MRKFPTDYLLHPSSSGYVKVFPTKVLPVGLLTVAPALVMAKVLASYLPLESICKAVIAETAMHPKNKKKSITMARNWPDRWTTFACNE